jgi:hypothetical protein
MQTATIDVKLSPILLSQEERPRWAQNAVLMVAMAFVLAMPSVALAYKKKASGESIHFSHEQKQNSSRPTVHAVAFTVSTVGKSGGYK